MVEFGTQVESILSRDISDDLKLKLVSLLDERERSSASQAVEQKRWWWGTPLAVALTGLITLSGNFIFDFARDRAATANTVTVETLKQELLNSAETLKADIAAGAAKYSTDLSLKSEEKRFQFEIVRTEFAKPDSTEVERASTLLFLARSGILNDLNVGELTRLAQEAIERQGPATEQVTIPPLTTPVTDNPQLSLNLTPSDLEGLYDQLELDSTEIQRLEDVSSRIIASKAKYSEVAAATGIPWTVVGVMHYLETNFDFNTHLTSDPLSGRTVHMPAGRPKGHAPPYTWEESAADLLSGSFRSNLPTLGSLLDRVERYNGLGYRKRGVYSPYLWGCSSLYTGGAYVSDGTFDPLVKKSQQCGAAVILKYLEKAKGISSI